MSKQLTTNHCLCCSMGFPTRNEGPKNVKKTCQLLLFSGETGIKTLPHVGRRPHQRLVFTLKGNFFHFEIQMISFHWKVCKVSLLFLLVSFFFFFPVGNSHSLLSFLNCFF